MYPVGMFFSLFAFSLHSTRAIRVVSCGLVVFIKADRLFIDEFNRKLSESHISYFPIWAPNTSFPHERQ